MSSTYAISGCRGRLKKPTEVQDALSDRQICRRRSTLVLCGIATPTLSVAATASRTMLIRVVVFLRLVAVPSRRQQVGVWSTDLSAFSHDCRRFVAPSKASLRCRCNRHEDGACHRDSNLLRKAHAAMKPWVTRCRSRHCFESRRRHQ